MKKAAAVALVLLALAGCSQTDEEPQAGSSGTVAVESPTIRPSVPPTRTPTIAPVSPTAPKTTTPQPTSTSNGPGETSFCDYLEETSGAQQQVEDPAEFVRLVKGAQAVAPGAIADDLALYAQSVQKLADTVTADPQTAAKANRWLSRNEAAITGAEANLNSYSESTCGRPFITGEG